MASDAAWLEVLAWTKALFEATTLGADLRKSYDQYRQDKATIAEAQWVSRAYSTFSEEKVAAIQMRLKDCRNRFVSEGSGAARKQCLCGVFQEAMDGNKGTLPQIDNWHNMFRQFNCSKRS